MKYWFSIAVLVLMFSVLKAQDVPAPGYLGRKFSIRYEVSPNLTLNPSLASDMWMTGWNNSVRRTNRTNLRHCFAIDHVVSRSITLGAGVEYMRSGFTWEEEDDFNSAPAITHHARTTSLYPAAEVRIFPLTRKGNIAPYGPFMGVRFGVVSNRVFSGKGESDEGKHVGTNILPAARYLLGYQGMASDRIHLIFESYVGLAYPASRKLEPALPPRYDQMNLWFPALHNATYSLFQLGVSAGIGVLLF